MDTSNIVDTVTDLPFTQYQQHVIQFMDFVQGFCTLVGIMFCVIVLFKCLKYTFEEYFQ